MIGCRRDELHMQVVVDSFSESPHGPAQTEWVRVGEPGIVPQGPQALPPPKVAKLLPIAVENGIQKALLKFS